MADSDKKADTARVSESRTFTYLAPGVAPDLTHPEATLDPELAKIRDEEIKANDVTVEARPEPTIDEELVKARDEQIAREQKLAGVKPAAKKEPVAKASAPAKKLSK